MRSHNAANEKKRKRNDDHAVQESEDDISELKRLKLSTGLVDDQATHRTRDKVNEQSWLTPDSPEPILCDPVSPPAPPLDEESEFKGYLRFNEYLGRIHQESRIHRHRVGGHEYIEGSANDFPSE